MRGPADPEHAAVDPATLLALGAADPVWLDRRILVCRGAFLPVPVPVACLPARDLGHLALICDGGLADRVHFAWSAGLEASAAAMVAREPRPLDQVPDLLPVLAAWTAQRLGDLDLPRPEREADLIVYGEDTSGRCARVAPLALADARSVLPVLAWPRWHGSALLVLGSGPGAGLTEGQEYLVRPALPVMRLTRLPAESGMRDALRSEIAARFALLALDLSSPPLAGWPGWLRRGTAGVVRDTASGQGVSPRSAWELRRQLGVAGLRRLLTDTEPDPAGATALCAPLLAAPLRSRLAGLLNALRQGTDAELAITRAYGLDLERLVANP